MENDIAHDWVDRIETRTECVDHFRASAAAATLADDAPRAGGPLPPLWHWMYCVTPALARELGEDGHSTRGIFPPPADLPRRMWAGGRLTLHAPLRVGDTLTRASSVAGIRETAGRSGRLLFVTLRHRYSRGAELLVDEEQDLVYRGPAASGGGVPVPGKPARGDARWERSMRPDPALLFRYSALTFNSHRIHYDRDYAMHAEGHAGLVVQGPLLATLLAHLAVSATGRRLASFSFRGVRPLAGPHAFSLCGAPCADGAAADLWTRDAQGCVTMEAHAAFGEKL
ncbi:MaoC family dehydratase N-terminal domain-containing protein [Paraburkholderia sp. B3]|uniref:FAS1-like dehydratase domain-containing protein n=1 Tax=Paraburkholderia sp. B3 TaxID=3134791 RepID=UPI0039823A2B